MQIFLIYYGLGQFPEIRQSFLWPFLREPYWCALLALTLNTAAYSSEIIRGGILSVPFGQIEAARACGMSRWLIFRRITVPQGLRVALPAYGNEIILMTRSTALASVITLMEVTGIASKIISRDLPRRRGLHLRRRDLPDPQFRDLARHRAARAAAVAAIARTECA